jgi:hypothetical protein
MAPKARAKFSQIYSWRDRAKSTACGRKNLEIAFFRFSRLADGGAAPDLEATLLT